VTTAGRQRSGPDTAHGGGEDDAGDEPPGRAAVHAGGYCAPSRPRQAEGSHTSGPARVTSTVMTRTPFQAVVDQHAAVVHRYLVAEVGRDRADDVLQETLMAALRGFPDAGELENPRAWLVTIAHRKALDDHRRRTAERRRVAAAAAVVATAGEAQRDGRDGPGTLDEGGLWGAVAGLPPRQRAAVALRYVADLPYADIGPLLDCSEEAARQNVRAALTTLRRTWTP
jgi:RNA polymerase sigma factor (sigma-70 family)